MALAVAALLSVGAPAEGFARAKSKTRTTQVSKKKRNSRKKNTRRKSRSPAPLVIKGTTGPISDTEPFVSVSRAAGIPKGLEGRTIALWPSHGRYFDNNEGQWRWQRPRLFGTVEDLLSTGFAIQYIAPMLENAGAYVMMPRERDLGTVEIIADYEGTPDGEYSIADGRHKWEEGAPGSGFALPKRPLRDGDNPFRGGTADMAKTVAADDTDHESLAQWRADFPEKGRYAVYVSYASTPESATDALYTVNHTGGSTEVTVNQRMGGGTWVYIGTYEFDKGMGETPAVELTNRSGDDDGVVSADAVKFGGGMGSVARGQAGYESFASGSPRANEGARYWLQYSGMPPEVYTPNEGENDYKDDYMSRALWVNYLSGGSEVLPDSAGLKIPVDMAFAFHTDAGIRDDGTTVGTLGLYSTDGGNPFGNGTARSANAKLANGVVNTVVDDIRALYDPDWTSRSVKDRRYYEVRETKVPAMIIEALSHQNFEDMKRALDPEFRFILSRAVYKGILRFLADRYNTPYVVQPLAVNSFGIRAEGSGRYTLSWKPTPDPREASALPTYYIIEERVDDGGFRQLDLTSAESYTVHVTDDRIHSYRVTAGNDGGVSFPSEALALYDRGGKLPEVMIVDGFSRTSAPGWFETLEFSGFDFRGEPAVADGRDIIMTGEQLDFRPGSEFRNNDFPGFGASRGNRERRVWGGNTRDYAYVHGQAVKAAGMGFVSSTARAFASRVPLSDSPRIVDLVLGLQKEKQLPGGLGKRHKTFSP
ncbi:MAG: N-acetylmuramoyl-L-alanine amidase, partial [Muribaculaceae bacterium]|nr:N-acetylmuramoyl-L-alanine amidase [Muribaculaceae bacterium]